ncbi:hypothetical protein [Laspinema olomoucense]|uniref:Uncharacterized protein n=1 Tax=Laspinema olomoucense D3b TaxID=2953688 RepID=A0ABT2N5L1_9CYAN|nr:MULTISPECIES: hypothetical protein [unclassified Laspinema]MCT7973988.1 hypothetical protein [Laspinema sp. D3d]MCT7977867.1 hypothetical protein [Laspinema sp. D3b]MCT7990545.1 hypothetical protein [Laspinema sp. D3a]
MVPTPKASEAQGQNRSHFTASWSPVKLGDRIFIPTLTPLPSPSTHPLIQGCWRDFFQN